MDTRLLFMVLKRSQELPEHVTLYRAFRTLAWSLAAMVTGLHPAHDEVGVAFGPAHHPERAKLAGQPLACRPDGTPLCGAWCELRGDWEFLRDALGLQHYWSRPCMCHLCAASSLPGPHYYGSRENLSGTGPVRETLVGPFHTGPNSWAARRPVSPLTEIPGFSIWRCGFDLMHTLELGILQKVIPAALQGLMGIAPGEPGARVVEARGAFAGRNRPAQCLAATLAYRQWASDTKLSSSSRVKRITARWVQGPYPEISSEHAKAAALRAMLPWVASVANGRRADSPTAELQATLLQELTAMDATYTRQPRFLSAGQAEQAQGHCTRALAALTDLVNLHPRGPWKVIPRSTP